MVNFSLRAFVALFIFLSVSSVYAQNRVVVIPLFGDDAPAPIEYAIGDTGPAGGIVFDVTNGGINGLEAAPVDQGTAIWGCSGTNIDGVVDLPLSGDLDPHSGAVNTSLIAVQCTADANNAAVLAAVYVWPNGQTDGFLPNKEELDLLYNQRNIEGLVGGFAIASNFYWSSSERNSSIAYVQDFVDGVQGGSSKGGALVVRAVRAF